METSSRAPWGDTGRRPRRRARTVEERGGAQGVCGRRGRHRTLSRPRNNGSVRGRKKMNRSKSLKIKIATKEVSNRNLVGIVDTNSGLLFFKENHDTCFSEFVDKTKDTGRKAVKFHNSNLQKDMSRVKKKIRGPIRSLTLIFI